MSTSGVLGRYIQMDSTMANWWRSVIACSVLYCIIKLLGIRLKVDSKTNRNKVFLSGVLLSIHWITYFYALDYSNVAIALLTLYSFPAFTAIIEPIYTKSPFKTTDVFLAMCSFVGVLILVPSFSLNNNYSFAILLGLISSITYVFRNLMLLEPAKHNPGMTIMFYQLGTLIVVVAPFWLFIDSLPSQEDWLGLFALAIITTVLAHTLFVMSLKKLDATTASLLSCLAPVLGIIWALIFLNEVPTHKTLIGGSIILATVVLKTISTSKQAKV